jgi:hypothetical protein
MSTSIDAMRASALQRRATVRLWRSQARITKSGYAAFDVPHVGLWPDMKQSAGIASTLYPASIAAGLLLIFEKLRVRVSGALFLI